MAFFWAPVDPNPSPTFSRPLPSRSCSIVLLFLALGFARAVQTRVSWTMAFSIGFAAVWERDSRSSASTPKLSSSSADSSRAYPGLSRGLVRGMPSMRWGCLRRRPAISCKCFSEIPAARADLTTFGSKASSPWREPKPGGGGGTSTWGPISHEGLVLVLVRLVDVRLQQAQAFWLPRFHRQGRRQGLLATFFQWSFQPI